MNAFFISRSFNLKKITLSTLLLTIAACPTLLPMLPNVTTPQQPSLEAQAEIQQCFTELEHNVAALDHELPDAQRDLEQMELAAHDANAPTTPIFATPVVNIINGQNDHVSIGIGLYGEDLVNIAAWFAEYGLDWYLFHHFKEFNIANVTENLLEKHETLLAYLDKLVFKKHTKGVIPNQSARALDTFFKKECFIDLNVKRALTSQLLSKIIIYILANECVSGVKHALIPVNGSKFDNIVSSMFAAAEQAETARRNHETQITYYISTSTIISTFTALVFFSPLTTLLCGYSNSLESGSRFFGTRPKLFDSYLFQLIKRFFVLTYFSRQLNSKYQDLWSTFIKSNALELRTLLAAYATAKKNHNTKDIEIIKTKLTELVNRGHAQSFFWWIKFKNAAFSKTNAVIETLLALPLFYKAGKTAYNFYNNINQ